MTSMNRPKIIVNVAMSADGKISLRGGKRIKISNEEDFRRVHELRNEVDAILVGINTIINDDPKLTVKEKFVKNPKNPIRIVLDSKLRIPENARVLNNMARTIIATTKDAKNERNAEIIRCGERIVDLKCLMEKLYEMGIRSVLVEGGGKTIASFLRENLVDELYIFVGSVIIGKEGTDLINIPLENIIRLRLLEFKKIGDGILLKYGVVND